MANTRLDALPSKLLSNSNPTSRSNRTCSSSKGSGLGHLNSSRNWGLVIFFFFSDEWKWNYINQKIVQSSIETESKNSEKHQNNKPTTKHGFFILHHPLLHQIVRRRAPQDTRKTWLLLLYESWSPSSLFSALQAHMFLWHQGHTDCYYSLKFLGVVSDHHCHHLLFWNICVNKLSGDDDLEFRRHGVSRLTGLVRIKYRFFQFPAKQKGSSGCPGNASSDDQVRIGGKIWSERRSAYITKRRRYLPFLSAQTFYMSAPLKCPSHQHLLPEDAFLFLN
jgi:hypothetical protein